MSPRPPHGPPHTTWLNWEDTLPLDEGLELFEDVVTALRAKGEVEIQGVAVKPPPEAFFLIRHEQLPRGEIKLKLEIEWEHDASGSRHTGKPKIS